MFAFIGPLIAFVRGNMKWIMIGLCAVIIAFGAWRYTRLVENYATAKQTIAQLEQNVRDKENALKLERELNALADEAISKLENENETLEDALERITANLPEDSGDLAPESIRETLKRLQEKETRQ